MHTGKTKTKKLCRKNCETIENLDASSLREKDELSPKYGRRIFNSSSRSNRTSRMMSG